MIAGQHSRDNLYPAFSANLPDDFPHPQPNIAMQNLVTVFGNPYQMITMIKRAVLAFVVLHDHTLFKNEPETPAAGSFLKRV